jgi:hypothetical protein
MEVRCNYCNWIGQYPSSAEFDTLAEFEARITQLDIEHDGLCPGEILPEQMPGRNSVC